MLTLPRRTRPGTLRRFAFAVQLGMAASVVADPGGEVILSGLADLSGIAVRSAPSGRGVEILLATSGTIVSTVRKQGSTPSPRTVVEGLPAEPAVLGWLAPDMLVAAAEDVAAYQLDAQGSVGEPAAVARGSGRGAMAVAIASNSRFLYVVSDGVLLRSRRVGRRLTALRATGAKFGEVAAVAISPLGYLVTLHTDPAAAEGTAWQMSFLDPEQPDRPRATLPVAGITKPRQLAYGPSKVSGEGVLYVLDAEDAAEPGIYRVETRPSDTERTALSTRRVIEVEQPIAFAVGPEGALYVASRGNGGTVRRYPCE